MTDVTTLDLIMLLIEQMEEELRRMGDKPPVEGEQAWRRHRDYLLERLQGLRETFVRMNLPSEKAP